jgi:hypothetical protein
MPTDNDEQDEESAEFDVRFVRIDRTALGRLFMITAETIDFEDHGDFVVVDSDDLRWLEKMAWELAMAHILSDDDTN